MLGQGGVPSAGRVGGAAMSGAVGYRQAVTVGVWHGQACGALFGTSSGRRRWCASTGCVGSARRAMDATFCTSTTRPRCPSAISSPSLVGVGPGWGPQRTFPTPSPVSLGSGLEQVPDATSCLWEEMPLAPAQGHCSPGQAWVFLGHLGSSHPAHP